jgi:hypothetical protein
MTIATTDGKYNLNSAETTNVVTDSREVGVQVESSRAKRTDPPAVSLELFCAQDKRSPNKLSSRKVFFDEGKLLDEKVESFPRVGDASLARHGVAMEVRPALNVEIEASKTKPKELNEDVITSESSTDPEIRDIANGMLSRS